MSTALTLMIGPRGARRPFGRSPDAADRTGQLLGEFGLVKDADRPVTGFSDGMRRRLDVATSMIVLDNTPLPERRRLVQPTTSAPVFTSIPPRPRGTDEP